MEPVSHKFLYLNHVLILPRWYEQAAHLDAYCHEALERLVGVPVVKHQWNREIWSWAQGW